MIMDIVILSFVDGGYHVVYDRKWCFLVIVHCFASIHIVMIELLEMAKIADIRKLKL